MDKFWNFIEPTKNEETRKLFLEGVIAEDSWWDDDITPQKFKSELNKGSGDIEVYINSPGGDCIAASQIYTMLMEYNGAVTIKIDGMAASAASVIAMAGNKVLMSPTAMMMIHDPLTMAWGNENEMKKAIEILGEFKESIINAYELKTNLSREEISDLMSEETWLNANKAIELGFADGIIGDETTSNIVAFAFSSKKIEKAVINKLVSKIEIEKGTPKKDLEKRLNLLK